jgi:hypothetical protein
VKRSAGDHQAARGCPGVASVKPRCAIASPRSIPPKHISADC